jgi:hypothetical protein
MKTAIRFGPVPLFQRLVPRQNREETLKMNANFFRGFKFALPISLIMWALCVWLMLSLFGCATCERHPVACSVGAAVIVGSVAATVEANTRHSTAPARANTQPVACSSSPAICR